MSLTDNPDMLLREVLGQSQDNLDAFFFGENPRYATTIAGVRSLTSDKTEQLTILLDLFTSMYLTLTDEVFSRKMCEEIGSEVVQ
jgi:hypothetical protein